MRTWATALVGLLVWVAGCGVSDEAGRARDDVGVVATERSALIDTSYVPDSDPNLPNPERGITYFYGDSVPMADTTRTLSNLFLYLGNVCDVDLMWAGLNAPDCPPAGPSGSCTSSVLKTWATAAIAERNAGRKVIFRPRYDTSAATGVPNRCVVNGVGRLEGVSYLKMQNHVQAIATMLSDLAIKPSLGFVEMGYLGSWGEWNTGGTNCLTVAAPSENPSCTQSCVTECRKYAPVLLAGTPTENRITFSRYVMDTYAAHGMNRPVGLRRPGFHKDLMGTGVLNTSLGFYNDCFMNDTNSEGGTFIPIESDFFHYDPIASPVLSTVQLAIDQWKSNAGSGTQGGETCDPNGGQPWAMHPDQVRGKLNEFNYHYLHARNGSPADFRQTMDTAQQWNAIKTGLGYRFHVSNVEYPSSAPPGATITVNVTVQNNGFANYAYDRKAYLVLLGPSSYVVGSENPRSDSYALIGAVNQTNQNVRSWTKGAATVFSQTFSAPTTPGTYDLHLYIPDKDCVDNPNCTPGNKAAYAVRLATRRQGNPLFDTETGTNDLDLSINVGDGTGTIGAIPSGDFKVAYDGASAYVAYAEQDASSCPTAPEIQKMSLASGSLTTLLSGSCTFPNYPVVTGANLFYYSRSNPRRIMKKDVAGSTPPPALFSTNAANVVQGIVTDGTRLYWNDGKLLLSAPITGGPATTHFTGQAWVIPRAVDGTDVYLDNFVINPSIAFVLTKVTLATGVVTTFDGTNERHAPLVILGNNVYYAKNQGDGSTKIYRMDKSSGAVTELYSRTQTCIRSMAMGGSTLYFTEDNGCAWMAGTGRVRRRSNAPAMGFVSTEEAALTAPDWLFVTGSDVFWVDGPREARVLRGGTTASAPASCEGLCGGPASGCWCDSLCTGYGDCCPDFTQMCTPSNSCDGRCGAQAPAGCYCDNLCTGYGDCCPNYITSCPG